MSPLMKTDSGWKLDRSALLTWGITLLIMSGFSLLGNYYGIRYTNADHERRIVASEDCAKEQEKRLVVVESYVIQDRVQTRWFEEKFLFIGKALDDIRKSGRRETK